MSLVLCSVSGHGFGHAAQMLPVLNELRHRVSGVRAILRTKVPPWFFDGRLTMAWEVNPVEQDIGCVQFGPLTIDVDATWAAHQAFHAEWEDRVAQEISAIRSAAPDLVVSNISHLAIEAAARAGVPAVGLCSLSWDGVLAPLLAPEGPARGAQAEVVQRIRQSYGFADLMIRATPGIPLSAFRKVVDIGPIAQPLAPAPARVRTAIGARAQEQVVLVSFGGIALDALPYDRLERLASHQFIVSGSVPAGSRRVHSAASIPVSFGTLLASADILVTKPGYSTVVEAVAQSKPVVYVRRYNFVDEDCLVGYLHRYGRATELSAADFASGRWEAALIGVSRTSQPSDTAPPATGAAEAAAILAGYL
ncbi:MAG: hypothetical protein ACREIK_02775 [Nitrospiraceae bacterium]